MPWLGGNQQTSTNHRLSKREAMLKCGCWRWNNLDAKLNQLSPNLIVFATTSRSCTLGPRITCAFRGPYGSGAPTVFWANLRAISLSSIAKKREGPNGPNNKHSLEKHLWYVCSTTSTMASLRVARLGWLPSKTTTAWRPASNLTDVPASGNESNQQSVKARSCPTQTCIALGKLIATYNFTASPVLH